MHPWSVSLPRALRAVECRYAKSNPLRTDAQHAVTRQELAAFQSSGHALTRFLTMR